jgi:hypothetical protein
MSWPVRLYPRAWRERYGAELEALLEARPPTLGDRLDLIRGALDARANPQVGSIAPERQRSPQDAWTRIAIIVGGALLWAWALGLALMITPWSGPEPEPGPFLVIVPVVGLVGALATAGALLALALVHESAVGRLGAIGAAVTALGLVLAPLGGGIATIVLLLGGTTIFCGAFSPRVVSRGAALVQLIATVVLVGGILAFIAGGGQDVRLIWFAVAYGPAWVVFGLALRPRSAFAPAG